MSYEGYSGYPPAQYGEPDRRPAKVTVLAILFGALASLGGMLSLVLVSALDAAEDSTAWFTRDSRPLVPGQYPGQQS